MTTETRRATRQLIQPDVPAFDASALDELTEDALVDLLMSIADDEFVIGYRDSEWTGIAPMLEEDVAFSSISQDEIGHARVLYEMVSRFRADTPDQLAFKAQPDFYHHARLIDHPITDWAFTITRRWLYETADFVRLSALADSSFKPLADLVAKIRREERYHLMHIEAWLERLATRPGEPHDRVVDALRALGPDVFTVFAPLGGEEVLVAAGILEAPMARLAEQWRASANERLMARGLPTLSEGAPPADGRDHTAPAQSFVDLWKDFTSVAFLEEGVEW